MRAGEWEKFFNPSDFGKQDYFFGPIYIDIILVAKKVSALMAIFSQDMCQKGVKYFQS